MVILGGWVFLMSEVPPYRPQFAWGNHQRWIGNGVVYMGTSLIIKRTPLGPYHRPMPRVLGGSKGVERFLMGEVPLYALYNTCCSYRLQSAERTSAQHLPVKCPFTICT